MVLEAVARKIKKKTVSFLMIFVLLKAVVYRT